MTAGEQSEIDRVSAEVERETSRALDAYSKARAGWTSIDVYLESLINGVSPSVSISAVDSINSRSLVPWAERGKNLDPFSQSALNKWISQGNEYIKDLNDLGGYASDDSLSSITAASAHATGIDIVDNIVLPTLDVTFYVLLGVIAVVLLALYARVSGR